MERKTIFTILFLVLLVYVGLTIAAFDGSEFRATRVNGTLNMSQDSGAVGWNITGPGCTIYDNNFKVGNC